MSPEAITYTVFPVNIVEPAQLPRNGDGQPTRDAPADITAVHVLRRSSGGCLPEVDGLVLAIPAADHREAAATESGVVRGFDSHADSRGDYSVRRVALMGVSIRSLPESKVQGGRGHTPRVRAFRPISEHSACSDATPPLDEGASSWLFGITAGRTEAPARAAKRGRIWTPRMARAEQLPALMLKPGSVLWSSKGTGTRALVPGSRWLIPGRYRQRRPNSQKDARESDAEKGMENEKE